MIRVALLLAFTATASAQPRPQPAPAPPVYRTSGEQLLGLVRGNYLLPKHLTATFEQTVTNAISGQAAPALGTLYVEKPDKLKFEFLQPKKANPKLKTTYLLDGKTMWAIEHTKLQYAKQPAAGSQLPALVGFFLGNDTLMKDFTPEILPAAKVPAGAFAALELTPKQVSAAYAKIVLVLDDKRMVTQVTIFDSSGNTQTLKFTNVVLDKAAPAGTFKLDPKSIAGFNEIKPK